MINIPTHRMVLEPEDDVRLEISVIDYPIHIPKIGDKFTLKTIPVGDEVTHNDILFEVTDIQHSIIYFTMLEQQVLVRIKKVN